MFFEKKDMDLSIWDVLYLDQEDVKLYNAARDFCAISIRISSDALLETDDGKIYHTGDGTVSFISSDINYKRSCTHDRLIVIHFAVTNRSVKGIECFTPENTDEFTVLFEKALSIWNQKKSGYRYKATAVLYEIVSLCYAQNKKFDERESKIRKSVNYIHRSYKNPDITIAEIAAKSSISEVYFRRLFKEEFGISPQKYIVSLRIKNAVNLITSGYFSLEEVARLSGYTDYKYFSVEFKRIVGISPSKYSYSGSKYKET